MTDEEGVRRAIALRAMRIDEAQLQWGDMSREDPGFHDAVVKSVQPYLDLFTSDAVIRRILPRHMNPTLSQEEIRGRSAISEWIVNGLKTRPMGGYRSHLPYNTVIDVQGDSASAVSDWIYLFDNGSELAVSRDVASPDQRSGLVIEAAGRYYDRLVRRHETWLFTEFRIAPVGL